MLIKRPYRANKKSCKERNSNFAAIVVRWLFTTGLLHFAAVAFLGGVPRTSGRAFRSYSGTKADTQGLHRGIRFNPSPESVTRRCFRKQFYNGKPGDKQNATGLT